MSEMRKCEAKELAGMFVVLALLVAVGVGLRSAAPELSEIAEVELPVETPAVATPLEKEDPAAPALLGPAGRLPVTLRIYEVLDSAEPVDPAPRLPVGVAVGI